MYIIKKKVIYLNYLSEDEKKKWTDQKVVWWGRLSKSLLSSLSKNNLLLQLNKSLELKINNPVWIILLFSTEMYAAFRISSLSETILLSTEITEATPIFCCPFHTTTFTGSRKFNSIVEDCTTGE